MSGLYVTIEKEHTLHPPDPAPSVEDVCAVIDTDCDNAAANEPVIPVQYKKKNAVDYWRNVGGKQRALKTVQHRYQKVTCKKDMYRWESQVNSDGTKHEKLQSISKHTYEEFLKARKENKIVHDIDLKR